MKRMLIMLGAIAIVGGLLVAGRANAGGANPSGGNDDSLRFETQQTSLLVNGATLTVTDDYLRDGAKVGITQIACFLTGPGPLALCQAAATLPGGQITSQGSVSIPPAVGVPFTVAITGGTGKYSGARGTIESEQTSQTTGTAVFHIFGTQDG